MLHCCAFECFYIQKLESRSGILAHFVQHVLHKNVVQDFTNVARLYCVPNVHLILIVTNINTEIEQKHKDKLARHIE